MKNSVGKLIVITVFALVGCNNKQKTMETPKTIQQIQNEKGVPVTTSKIDEGMLRRIERSSGTLQGTVEAVLANGLGGTVKEIGVNVGETVKKDAVVAVMQIDGGSPVDVAQSAYEYAEKAYGRAQKLQVQGAISTEQVDGARVQYEDAKRNLGQATVGVNVTAPFSGTVIEIYERVGSKIGAKTPMVKIADLARMRIEMQVNEESIGYYKNKQKTFITVGKDTVWGFIDRIALGANGMAHSFKVTALFPNKTLLLKPGEFKRVHTILEEKEHVLYVPIEVVNFNRDNTPYLYTAHNGKAVKTAVMLGITNDNFYEIAKGCTSDNQIIMSGLTMLQDGTKINIVTK